MPNGRCSHSACNLLSCSSPASLNVPQTQHSHSSHTQLKLLSRSSQAAVTEYSSSGMLTSRSSHTILTQLSRSSQAALPVLLTHCHDSVTSSGSGPLSRPQVTSESGFGTAESTDQVPGKSRSHMPFLSVALITTTVREQHPRPHHIPVIPQLIPVLRIACYGPGLLRLRY